MRCTIFSLATLFIISLSAFAAPQNKEPQRKRLSEIPKELNLSAEQPRAGSHRNRCVFPDQQLHEFPPDELVGVIYSYPRL